MDRRATCVSTAHATVPTGALQPHQPGQAIDVADLGKAVGGIGLRLMAAVDEHLVADVQVLRRKDVMAGWPDTGDLSEVEYLIAWQVPPGFLAQLPRLKVLFSSGAGIDHVDLSAVPAHIPLVRMVEPGIINGMVEYVSLAVLALHRDFFDYAAQKAARVWHALEVPPASRRHLQCLSLIHI